MYLHMFCEIITILLVKMYIKMYILAREDRKIESDLFAELYELYIDSYRQLHCSHIEFNIG